MKKYRVNVNGTAYEVEIEADSDSYCTPHHKFLLLYYPISPVVNPVFGV